jgi:hypothetical protein
VESADGEETGGLFCKPTDALSPMAMNPRSSDQYSRYKRQVSHFDFTVSNAATEPNVSGHQFLAAFCSMAEERPSDRPADKVDEEYLRKLEASFRIVTRNWRSATVDSFVSVRHSTSAL